MVTSTKTNRASTPRKPITGSRHVKSNGKPNTTILSFFKKTDKPEDSLFVESTNTSNAIHEDLYAADDADRFNEVESPLKRRRLSQEPGGPLDKVDASIATAASSAGGDQDGLSRVSKPRSNMPFLDSESEDEEEHATTPEQPRESHIASKATGSVGDPSVEVLSDCALSGQNSPEGHDQAAVTSKPAGSTPVRSPDGTIPLEEPHAPDFQHEDLKDVVFDDLEALAEMDGFDMDTFEGEEMRVMRFMQEQALLEAEEAGEALNEELIDDNLGKAPTSQPCPICDGELSGLTTDDATKHVNSCLDGNPIPIPNAKIKPLAENSEVEVEEVGKRFARAAVPRPGQANPFEQESDKGASRSAFSTLMSNNAEDTAWATAAASEHASRGRPAYERECPFYKRMPHFSICVDAFRYGAVEDCKAYFLSHFHSDHYIGLTANWRHGPIYCSKVTGSLVRNQLRTAAKWVVELDFEKSYGIPGTDGASVTMIPANHCPGSSMFLFEKTMGKGSNRSTKRILHCGDFRACPAHIRHPLLKPTILDASTSKIRQQKIDMCYLDTTYLNPRYSFPPQEDVIKACADLCTSMSADPKCRDDIWERTAQEEGTQSVSKFFQNTKDLEKLAKEGAGSGQQQRLLVVSGTYSIGKERICKAIAKALNSKIFASPAKIKICKQLEDPELSAMLTSNPLEAQVHMQMLMELRAETLQEYLNSYKPHFSRIVGFRPSGWNFRPANGKSVGANTSPGSIPIQQILHGKGWRTRFGYKDFIPQRGSTKEAMCFGVPYSEHSSFRELTMFVMSLRIEKIIPTVNVGSIQSRQRMRGWTDRWTAERRRGGLVTPLEEGVDEDDDKLQLWDGKPGKGGGAWW